MLGRTTKNKLMNSKIESSLKGKSGASHHEEWQKRKASPGLDRGLKVVIDRNFHLLVHHSNMKFCLITSCCVRSWLLFQLWRYILFSSSILIHLPFLSASVMVPSSQKMRDFRYSWVNPLNFPWFRWSSVQKVFIFIQYQVRHLSLAPGRQHDVEVFGSRVTTDDSPASREKWKNIRLWSLLK